MAAPQPLWILCDGAFWHHPLLGRRPLDARFVVRGLTRAT